MQYSGPMATKNKKKPMNPNILVLKIFFLYGQCPFDSIEYCLSNSQSNRQSNNQSNSPIYSPIVSPIDSPIYSPIKNHRDLGQCELCCSSSTLLNEKQIEKIFELKSTILNEVLLLDSMR